VKARVGAGWAERGSISVTAVAVMVVLLVMAAALTDVARVFDAASRAQVAADAAALAAAQEMVLPSSLGPAGAAGEYARRNGATLDSCECRLGSDEAVAEVRVEVGELLFLPRSPVLHARARAVVDWTGSPEQASAATIGEP
jgi:secretion/DNA translocation related TadE-like protein